MSREEDQMQEPGEVPVPGAKPLFPISTKTAERKRPRPGPSVSPPPSGRGRPLSRSYSPTPSRSRSPPPRRSPPTGGGHGHHQGQAEENWGTVFVGNLSHDTTERGLREFFEQYGRVLSTKVVINQETQRSKGFGFVKYEDARDADDAIAEADGKVLDGRNIKCNIAKYHPRNDAYRGGFRGGGDFRGRGFRGDYRGSYGRGGFGRSGGRFPPRRSRSRSLGRYSPGRYSPGRDRYSPRRGSPSVVSFSRSASPPPKRPRAHRARPNGGEPGSARARHLSHKGKPSPSGSYTSGSSASSYSSDSEASGKPKKGAAPPAAAGAPGVVPPPGAFKKELLLAKRREGELTSRLSVVEAEATTVRATLTEYQDQVADLSDRLQRSEEASKQYRKWLAALADYVRAALGAKAAKAVAEGELAAREEELGLFLAEADSFLGKDKLVGGGGGSRRRRRDKDGSRAGEAEAPTAAEDAPAMGNGVAAAMPAAPGAEAVAAAAAAPAGAGGEAGAAEAPGAWEEDMDVEAGDMANPAHKFKPGIKFKLQQ